MASVNKDNKANISSLHPLSPSPSVNHQFHFLRCVTWNSDGTLPATMHDLLNYMDKHKIDVACLQETSNCPEQTIKSANKRGYYPFHNDQVMIIIHKRLFPFLDSEMTDFSADYHGRACGITLC